MANNGEATAANAGDKGGLGELLEKWTDE